MVSDGVKVSYRDCYPEVFSYIPIIYRVKCHVGPSNAVSARELLGVFSYFTPCYTKQNFFTRHLIKRGIM